MEGQQPSPSPSPNPSLFRDISNFKTPKHSSQNPNFESPFPHFFTASKQTPSYASSSFRRRSSIVPSSRSKAARKLKAFELEQSQSSRKVQIRKEKSLKTLSKSLSAWLNFLFESPKSCGCDLSALNGADRAEELGTKLPNGKRDSLPGSGIGTEGHWRNPKRQRDCSWRAGGVADVEPLVLSSSSFSSLKVSLQEVCSFDDLTQRMMGYLNSESCKEVLSVMSQVAKNIDEGRLKMKTHCPIVTDVGTKEKATRVLMCYNPIWLRIGLYVIFGGDSLIPSGDVDSDQELVFLKMVVEKQLFSHAGLAKTYAYNKMVEGLYRPGYFEALGNVILKRFLLLVLVLDRAKSQSSLPIKYGIDGIDGGSPLLFGPQFNIKSSRHVIQDFLSSEVMHGEGDLIAHLVIIGYKVSYQQYPLLEYDFRVTDLFEDFHDGIRLCRAIQLLLCDKSILTKMVVPSNNHKKNLVNCGVGMQYLKRAGVPLSDEDGMMILAEDVASGEKELTLSILWNIFIHLQIPLLINKMTLFEEICKVNEADKDYSNCNTSTPLEMLLEWIQAICQKYDLKIDNFASLVDGKAMWCLIDYYFCDELRCSCCHKKAHDTSGQESNFWATDCSDALHNFILSQKLAKILGNFPEVLQISDILEHNGACNERSVIVLLVFLSSQLIGRKNMDQLNLHKLLGCTCQSPEMRRSSLQKRFLNSVAPLKANKLDEYNSDAVRKFEVVQAWWRDMVKRNHNCEIKQTTAVQCSLASKHGTYTQRVRSATIIQSRFRGMIVRWNFLKIKNAASFLQTVIRAWLTMKVIKKSWITSSKQLSSECRKHPDIFGRYLLFMVERHRFIRLKKSVLVIQHTARAWITRRRQSESTLILENLAHNNRITAAITIQSYFRRWRATCKYIHMVSQLQTTELINREKKIKDLQIWAAVEIQLAWRKIAERSSNSRKCLAATRIQSHWHGWLMRRNFLHQKKAITKVQSWFRCLKCWRDFKQYRIATRSAIIIQSHIRGMISRREASRERHLIIVIQSHLRGWLTRRDFLFQREAAIKIQTCLRCLKYWRAFQHYRLAVIEIQRLVRGQVARNRQLGASFLNSTIHSDCIGQISGGCFQNLESETLLCATFKLQRWWKRILWLKSRTRSAIKIQSRIRGWIARQKARREKHRIAVIQAYWKGYIARKESRGRLLDLRLRVQKSAANVDDGMRLINRLVSALSELLSIRSIRSILHTCATLDMATEHSEKCCETLVAAGAIDTLLKLIRSVSQSIPDLEVLKHSMSTLRNLARFPHLAEVLINTNGCVEIILWEFVRNKEGSYFIASELLKKLCSTKKGVEAVRKLPALVKRLQSLVEDLTRKVTMEKRKTRPQHVKESTEKRLKEAVELFKLIANG